ncbi:MAG: MarR family transcriptional regulator [Clostridia bacterium]|nr:MarR family transcriptional regulator [Clostridia bacterium]
MINRENDVILAVLKLSRAMRRCPPDPGKHPFPPAAGRLLECVAENNGVSSRELCEMLDIRPSSLSEMLARAESEGWITRTTDEEDRRIQRVALTEKGSTAVTQMREAREADYEKKTACFTEEEKAQFCTLINRLSDHMESLAADIPEFMRRPPRHGRPPFPPKDGIPGEMPCPGEPPFPPEGEFPGEPDFPHPGKPHLPPNTRMKC